MPAHPTCPRDVSTPWHRKTGHKSAELSSESSMEESVLGLKSNTDVWVKENQLLEARVDFSNAKRQRFMAKLRLYALTGKLSLKAILLKQNNGG